VKTPSLTDLELDDLQQLLVRSPGLWPFGVVCGEVGVPLAVEACRTGEIPPGARARLLAANYQPGSSLPAHRDIVMLLWGVRIHRKLAYSRPLHVVVKRVGLSMTQVRDCLRLLACHDSAPGVAAYLHEGGANEAIGE